MIRVKEHFEDTQPCALPGSPPTASSAEYDQLYAQYEEAIARINTLTLDAEIARIEFEQVFNAVSDAILVIGIDGRILRANTAALHLVGRRHKADIIGTECRRTLHSAYCDTPQCSLERIRAKRRGFEEEMPYSIGRRKDVPMLLTATPLKGPSYELAGIVAQFKDISELKRQQRVLLETNEQLQRLVSIDALTQVANRRTFDLSLDREWRRMFREKRPLSLILCDVDFFKPYNDHYGHQAGDECLRAVAACIQRCTRRPGDIVARYGGEEFAVILADTPSAGAFYVAEAIRAQVQDRALAHRCSSVAEVITISLGIATTVPSLPSGLDRNQLIAEADAALYRAKKAGRNRVWCAAPESRAVF